MKSLLIPCLLAIFISSSIDAQITDYQVFLGTSNQPGQSDPVVVLRQWRQAGAKKLLILHPADLRTEVVPASSLRVQPDSWENIRGKLSNTPYIKAMDDAYETSHQLRDAAIAAVNRYPEGLDITVDLCSAKGPLDRNFFNEVVKMMNPEEKPVRVSVAVTGLWIIKHADDLNWLKQQDKSGILQITWVNHSFHHQAVAGQTMALDALLQPGNDVDNQILQTEKLLLVNNITPSIFFRFPGDVSKEMVFKKVANYGLIGMGSDAWLARGQYPRNSRTVLVQPNGDEPLGKEPFLETLRNNRSLILRGRWMMYDLSGF